MFVNKLLLINLIAVRLRCLASPGRGVKEMVGNRGLWYERGMGGGVFLVRRRHVDHCLVWSCACPCSR
jgi:hypothetical protein